MNNIFTARNALVTTISSKVLSVSIYRH